MTAPNVKLPLKTGVLKKNTKIQTNEPKIQSCLSLMHTRVHTHSPQQTPNSTLAITVQPANEPHLVSNLGQSDQLDLFRGGTASKKIVKDQKFISKLFVLLQPKSAWPEQPLTTQVFRERLVWFWWKLRQGLELGADLGQCTQVPKCLELKKSRGSRIQEAEASLRT